MIKIWGEPKVYKHLPIVLTGFVLFFQSIPAWSFTLPEAVNLAIETYPEVRAAEEYKKSLEQKLRKEFAGYLPVIDLSTGYGRENTDNPTTRAVENQHDLTLDRGEAGLTLNQMLFDGFKVRYKVAQAEAQAKAAQATLDRIVDDTALKAVQFYVDVVIKHDQLRLVENNVQLHKRILSKVRKKFQGGAGNQADVHQAESRTYLASANLASNQAAYKNAQAKFLEITGQVPLEEMIWPEAPDVSLPLTLDEALKTALRHNPGLESARFNLASVKAELETAKAPFWPKVNMELGATNNANMGGSPGHSKSASAMLRMRYNLFQGGADIAEIQATRNRLGQSQQILDKAQRTLEEQIREAWNKLVTTRDRVDFLMKHVTVSERVTASYHDQFKMGKRTLLDLLNSENELFSAQNALLFEELTYIKTSYEMLTHMGTLQPAIFPHRIPEGTLEGTLEEANVELLEQTHSYTLQSKDKEINAVLIHDALLNTPPAIQKLAPQEDASHLTSKKNLPEHNQLENSHTEAQNTKLLDIPPVGVTVPMIESVWFQEDNQKSVVLLVPDPQVENQGIASWNNTLPDKMVPTIEKVRFYKDSQRGVFVDRKNVTSLALNPQVESQEVASWDNGALRDETLRDETGPAIEKMWLQEDAFDQETLDQEVFDQ